MLNLKGKYKSLVLFLFVLVLACTEDKKPRVEVLKNNPYVDIIKNPLSAETVLDSSLAAKITFEEILYNFDTISEGEKVQHTFHFTNTGKNPLSIFEARSTCGCTVAEYSKELINAGQKGFVKVDFDSKGKTGYQNKPVTLYANTLPQTTVVRVRGFVNPNN